MSMFDLTRGEDYLQMECAAGATSYPLGTNGDAVAAASATATQGTSMFASASAAVPNGRHAFIKRVILNNTGAAVACTLESHNSTTTGFQRALTAAANLTTVIDVDIFTSDGFRLVTGANVTATVIYKAGPIIPSRPGANP